MGNRFQAALAFTIAAAGTIVAYFTSGVWLWLGGSACFGGGLVCTVRLAALALPRSGLRVGAVSANIWLLCATLGMTAMAAEAWLAASEPDRAQPTPVAATPVPIATPALIAPDTTGQERWRHFYTPEAEAAWKVRQGYLTMPPAWEVRYVQVPGATTAFYWHGALHVKDNRGMRFTGPVSAKQPGVFRIAVFGDSLTYGDGVEQAFTYPSLLAKELGARGPIEVINYGHDGWQSEDILNGMRDLLPESRPDLVLYGVCLNDFLKSGMGQYSTLKAYSFPLPSNLKYHIIKRTRLGKLLDDSYDRLLRTIRLRVDFYDDILGNIAGYQERFSKDVAAMNTLVTGLGLPPIVGMVLDQYPHVGGRGQKIATIAETSMRNGGMDVIPTDDYYRVHDGIVYRVSAWEGHPDERAHAIFADLFYAHLIQRPDLGRCLSQSGQAPLARCAN